MCIRDRDTGSAGKTAIAPQMRINAESNEWEISTDNGTTWTSTGIKATGEKGDSMFSAIDTNNGDYVCLLYTSILYLYPYCCQVGRIG